MNRYLCGLIITLLILVMCITLLACGNSGDQPYKWDLLQVEKLLGQGETEKAIDLCTQAIENDPALTEAYGMRGLIYHTMQRLDEAIADYNKAIELDPNYATAYELRGQAYLNKGQADLALIDCNRAIVLDPSVATAYNKRGFVYEKMGENQLAIADFQKVLTMTDNTKLIEIAQAAIQRISYTDTPLVSFSTNEPQWIIVHHTGGTDEDPTASTKHHTFDVVNEWHRNLWPDFISSLGYHIGYHYFIDAQGNVTHGRTETEEAAHTIVKNTESIGICLAGNFDRVGEMPTEAQEESLIRLIRDIQKRWGIPDHNIVPHRKFANKTCYGVNLPDDWVQSLFEK